MSLTRIPNRGDAESALRWARCLSAVLLLCLLPLARSPAGDGNRLTYLDAFCDPYYPNRDFPRLTTPQWIGEDAVEAVVILSIDDLGPSAHFEKFLRPILERLKQIDGRAPVSIFALSADADDPQVAAWLREGLSLEVHTIEHPCPLFQGGDFERALRNVHDCIDNLWQIPGPPPVAYRGPCSDIWNTQSPRFYTEIFRRPTSAGRFLEISSTVHHVFTTDDPTLPSDLVNDEEGKGRFTKYTTGEIPILGRADYVYTNHIANYPYPYVVARLGWEFPCTIPGDHQAAFYVPAHGRHTVRDWKAALDATVIKQGVMTLVFHPHGKCEPEEIVALIDHAVSRYGSKVKFLTLREARDRLLTNVLAGQTLRALDGGDNGVRVLDLDADGYLDVVIGNADLRQTRVWDASKGEWRISSFPTDLATLDEHGRSVESGVRFGVLDDDGAATMLVRNEVTTGAWRFRDGRWAEVPARLWGASVDGAPVMTRAFERDTGVRLRDVDGDGRCELIVGGISQNAVFSWSEEKTVWRRREFSLPPRTSIVDALGRDAGLRFVDLNSDGFHDVLFSNEERYSVNLYIPAPGVLRAFDHVGWTRPICDGLRGENGEIPRVVRADPYGNNGVWFAKGRMWVQNEEIGDLPHHTRSLSYDEIVSGFQPPPLSPEESLQTIELGADFEVELVAAEPLVRDPIAIEWGADGRLWVVEMRDYPLGRDGSGGAVRVLEDTDGDGQYDRSTLFADGLHFPSGVMPWRRGALISAAPDILYAEDRDGDGQADHQQILYSGFRLGNQQHRVNGFEYGLDGWLYCANGGSGGRVRSHITGKVVDIQGRDFRIAPGTGALETEPGVTEFGRHRDDWGNWFGNTYANWGWHFFLPDRYLRRNPHLPATRVRHDLAHGRPIRRIHRRSRLLTRPQMGQPLGQVTAPCSLNPYRDTLFGEDFAASVFVGEVDKNIVRRMQLVPDGVSFTAQRASGEETREFLASTDNWFRPTQTRTGPDGALYVVDMYRLIIEHQEYYPDDLQELLDFRAGDDRGRIYRVFPRGAKLRRVPRLVELDTPRLVAALEHENGWQRDVAQRLLVDRGALGARKPLESLARRSPLAKVRLQALYTLAGLRVLSESVVVAALGDEHPGVRLHAVRLSEPFLRGGDDATAPSPALARALLARVDDPALRVRYQLAFTLGEWRDARASSALTELALGALSEGDLQTAVMSSAVPHLSAMLEALLALEAPPPALLERLLALAAARRDQPALIAALESVAQPNESAGTFLRWQYRAAVALLDALAREDLTLADFFVQAEPNLRRALGALDPLFAAARTSWSDPHASVDERVVVAGLVGRGRSGVAADLARLSAALQPQAPPEVQRAAVEAIGRTGSPDVPEILLAGWGGHAPDVRRATLGVLGARDAWLEATLDAVSVGRIAPGEIGLARQQALLRHRSAPVREKAGMVFSGARSDRAEVVHDYSGVSQRQGDPAAGAILFRKHCAACHRVHGEGKTIGPDLDSVVEQSIPFLVESILDPSKAVDPEFTQYLVVTRSGTSYAGVIAEETPTTLRIKVPEQDDQVLLREEIVQLEGSSVSIMPNGVEQHVDVQGLADLIAWLKSGG